MERSALALRVDLLGPVALWIERRAVDVPGVRRRALLAVLALEHDRSVSASRLVEALWPDEPPANARQALYNHVSRLRGHLGPMADRLARVGAGYRLELRADELDVDTARRLAATATATDVTTLREAYDLWRGPALAEFDAMHALEGDRVRLAELRATVLDRLLEARLAQGDTGVVVDAAAAAADAPYRERTTLVLVRALARSGRAAEALSIAAAYRRRLIEETGLDPSPALGALEQEVAAGEQARPDIRPRAHVRPDGPLVGRHHDREEVHRLLGANATVTLTGPGGVGKTRLALEVAAELADHDEVEVAVVPLAAVDRPQRLCPAIASNLGLRLRGDVGPEDIAAALGSRPLLLVLDNCEHLAERCRAVITTVRERAPGVRVLATSRVTLHVPGEYVLRLQPLPVPRDHTDLASLRRQPAVRAFLEHARRRRPGYELEDSDAVHVVEVLRRLDGLPLGIELAARQVSVMPLRDVRDRLDRALDLAIGRPGGEDQRQRTLRASIDSSYRLLDEPARDLLLSLAPFPGGFDVATVEAMATGPDDPLDVLHRLVDASLLVADPQRGRFRLLFTVREFLHDELRGRDALGAAETAFVARCVALAEELGELAIGPHEVEADRRLRAELDNLRAAWDQAAAGDLEARVRICVALGDAMTWRDLRELWSWALELAGDPQVERHPNRPAVLSCAAEAARLQGDLDTAERLADEAIALAGPQADPELVYRAWSVRGSVAHFRGDFARARDHWIRSGEGRPRTSGAWLASAALASSYAGDAPRARALLDRAHAADAATPSASQIAFTTYVEGELRVTQAPEESIPFYLEAISRAHSCGAHFVEGVAGVALASARARSGDVAGAARQFGELITDWQRSGHLTQLWTTARNAAALLARAGRPRVAALVLACADAQPGAAAVNSKIARHSGRLYLPLDDLVARSEVEAVRAEAARLTAAGVLDALRAELAELA